ncbi:hypothetical protein [Zavarzinella formosa]|uniref:hypothetical protein n=1 Tax=Zavarzinella formosa TaxID=360055 RepID=UPI00030D191F|nr:hypothetical protein [Zavarzinella formosa]
MSELNRRDAAKLAAGLAVAGVLGAGEASARETEKPRLDAVFHVMVNAKQTIRFRFDLPGKADQSFESEEYRYAVLDKDGIEVRKALMILGLNVHTTQLPKKESVVEDYPDYMFDNRHLKSGEEYYLVVSVRNLTALAKFKAP